MVLSILGRFVLSAMATLKILDWLIELAESCYLVVEWPTSHSLVRHATIHYQGKHNNNKTEYSMYAKNAVIVWIILYC